MHGTCTKTGNTYIQFCKNHCFTVYSGEITQICMFNVSKYNIDKTAGVCYGFHTTVCVYSPILHEMGNKSFIAVTVLHFGVLVLDLSSDEQYW